MMVTSSLNTMDLSTNSWEVAVRGRCHSLPPPFFKALPFNIYLMTTSVPYPGSGAFLTRGSEMRKKSVSGSGMNNPAHISKSLETIFWVKILNYFDPDSGSGMEKIRSRHLGWEKFGSGIRDGKNSVVR
jgi:hypothetical protein